MMMDDDRILYCARVCGEKMSGPADAGCHGTGCRVAGVAHVLIINCVGESSPRWQVVAKLRR